MNTTQLPHHCPPFSSSVSISAVVIRCSIAPSRIIVHLFFSTKETARCTPCQPPPSSSIMAFVAPVALSHGLSHASGTRVVPQRARAPAAPVARWSMAAERKFFIGGNWKCNLTKAAIADLCAAFNDGPVLDSSLVDVVVAPPAPYLESTRAALRADFGVGAQNAWISAGSAHTGEVDAKMIKDVGADWVILGHSERRHLPQIKESDAFIAEKARYALSDAALNVIYCVGELLEEREAGETLAVCERQLAALDSAISDWGNVVVAYEPVWAIGTGKVATPEQAEEVHLALRTWLAKNVSQNVADSTRILYGGSVSPANCQDLARKPNIDGFLVGGASLKPGFLDIVDSYKSALASAV